MSMRDSSDRWILIQQNTFTNWVNEQLRVSGIETTEFVRDLEHDFQTGVKLCQLVESLQGKKIGRIIKKPMNHHQELENVTIALNAISNDNVRLVNIGMSFIYFNRLPYFQLTIFQNCKIKRLKGRFLSKMCVGAYT